MKRYWDLTEKQRSELTAEQVQALLTVELMERGVVKVDAPILRSVDKLKLAMTRFYTVSCKDTYHSFDAVFDTVEKANAFIALQPSEMEYDYSCGGSEYTFVKACGSYQITPVDLCSQQDVMNLKGTLSKIKADKEANDREIAEYNKAVKAVDEATRGLWDDWHACLNKANRNRKVTNVFEDYVKTCEGDSSLASRFLAKVYSQEQIAEAFTWFDLPIPSTDLPAAVEAAA